MPTVSSFMGITITMYFDDHPPPHFHARAADRRAKIRIDTLAVIESTLRRRQLGPVLTWAGIHKSELEANWSRAREGVPLDSIEPLR